MRLHPRLAFAVLLAATSLAAQPAIHPDELALKPQIDAAIDRGVEHLMNGQVRDGSFSARNHPVGQTALRVYALVKCGVRMDHPVMRRAMAYLKTARTVNTYELGCTMLALGATGDPQYKPAIKRMLDILLGGQGRSGSWRYRPGQQGDLSCTQYAALGLWVAQKAGLSVPSKAWHKLIAGTLLHQETPRYVDVKITKKTGVGKKEIAGFSYGVNAARSPKSVTHSMTTAGVSALKICEIGLGKRLRKTERRSLQRNIDLGLAWFDANYSVTAGGGWNLYYLYGLERVGALNRTEKFGDNWWYVTGAKHLLAKQNKKTGGWGNGPNTAFALLFLRRATRGGPISGGSGGKRRHLFSAGGPKDDIALRGAGQKPVMLYINRFGESLLAEHSTHGLRILKVEYYAGKRKLGELSGKPGKAWKSDTFLYRCTTLEYGTHTVEARITIVDSETPTGEISSTMVIKSKPMKVIIRDVLEPWMDAIAEMQKDNLLHGQGKNLVVTVSSTPKTAKHLHDGNDGTHWMAAPKDAIPTLVFTFRRPVTVRRVILSQPLQNHGDTARIGVITAVEIAVGKSKKFKRYELNSNPLAPTDIEFLRAKKIDKLSLRIIERSGKAGLPVGFAEVAMKSKKKR